jgi:hypothetical protein
MSAQPFELVALADAMPLLEPWHKRSDADAAVAARHPTLDRFSARVVAGRLWRRTFDMYHAKDAARVASGRIS